MDRATVYTQEQGRSVDFLFAQRATMIGLGKLAQAIMGGNTMVRGLAVAPNSPAALNVLVGIGEIYSLTEVDATAWGALPADTTDFIVKQGLNMAAQTISTPAPVTGGYSICYLIEAQYQDQDTNAAVLPFYNSANPQQPLNGQGGSGAAQATERQGVCVIQAKAGIAAPTGTQVAPTVDSGWTALAVVTVAFGATTVVAGNIAVPAGVPQVTSILQMMQTESTNYAVDTSGTANQINIALTPPITAYADGMPLNFRAANNSSGAVTINAGPGSIQLSGAAGALQSGEIVAGGYYTATYQSNTGTAVLVGQGSGAEQVNPATQSKHAVQLGQVGHGQCRLVATSGTVLTLEPFNGNNVIVNGIPLTLPNGGLTVSNTGLAASTLYYVYLGGTTASPTLTLSTTGHTLQPNGIVTQTGNAALTLVGMVYTSTATPGAFVSTTQNQQLRDWFQRRRLSIGTASVNNSTSSTSLVALGTIAQCLVWADETFNVAAYGASYNTTAAAGTQGLLYVNGAAGASSAGYTWSSSASAQTNFVSATVGGAVTEGLYTFQLYGEVVGSGNANFSWSLQGSVG